MGSIWRVAQVEMCWRLSLFSSNSHCYSCCHSYLGPASPFKVWGPESPVSHGGHALI
jgi:hypothetical protein